MSRSVSKLPLWGVFSWLQAQIASDVWPESTSDDDWGRETGDESGEDGYDLEAQVAKELVSIKRPRKEQRFGE